ncbi:MAG TPA: ABC transporter permease [Candidatus Limnocylindrales bacterium]|nr:ABC transporter permease [Candidatus Limnocylindrales bacterium]
MATMISAAAPPRAARRRFHITRTQIFGVVFLIAAVSLLNSALRLLSPDSVSTLTFGPGLPQIPVPTAAYAGIVGVFYGLAGVVALLRVPSLKRWQRILLIISGILIVPTLLIVASADNSTNVTTMLSVSLRLSTPIVLGALAGIWAERSGVVNIAIEGMMLTGACFGFVAFTLLAPSLDTSTAQFVGVLVSVLAGGIAAALLAWLAITFKADQIVSGTAINILAIGVTSLVRREVLLSSEAGRETLQQIPIPVLKDIPVLGEVLFSGRPIFYMMFVLLIFTTVVLFYTRWGLRTRAVGENPHAADTVGINVIRLRWRNVLISGMIAGLAGAWFSLETTGSFDDNMTSGRGFIALAAMIFGNWMPFGAFAGGVLFGFSDALGQRFQFLGVQIPPQFLQMVPYVITIIVLAGLVGRSRAPKADGQPYTKEGS